MPTLQELEADVRATTEDLATEIDALVAAFIRQAQREAEDRHTFLAMEAVATFVTVIGQRKLADKPSAWVRKLDRAAWLHGQSGALVPIEWAASRGQMHALYGASPDVNWYGSPKHLLELGSELWVYPLPDDKNPVGTSWSLGTYQVTVLYGARLATLSAPTDTNWFSENLSDYLVSRAASEALTRQRDFDAATVEGQKARAYLSRAVRRDKRARFHQQSHLTPIPQSMRRVGRERPWS
jgi:hypothetical protein